MDKVAWLVEDTVVVDKPFWADNSLAAQVLGDNTMAALVVEDKVLWLADKVDHKLFSEADMVQVVVDNTSLV